MYKFIEIQCQECNHKFVYSNATYKGTREILYKRVGHTEKLRSTPCPKCNTELALVEKEHIGININNTSIEIAQITYGV